MSEELERKRQLSYGDLESSSKKPKPLNQLSVDGPLTQSDVVYFKKEAIWRQMSIYKEKYQNLFEDYKGVQSRYESNEQIIHIIDLWYEQLIKLLGDDLQSDEIDDSLLSKLPNIPATEAILETRRRNLLRIITPLKDRVGVTADESELKKRVDSLTSDLMTLRAENETLKTLKESMAEKIDHLQDKLISYSKNKLRMESKTLKRVDESLDDVTDNTRNADTEQSNKQENIESMVDNEEFEMLKSELTTVKAENQVIIGQLENFKSSLESAKKESTGLSERLNNLKEADIEGSELYKELRSTNLLLKESITSVRKDNEVATRKLKELETSQGDFSSLVNKEISEENAALKAQIQKSEEDLVRIRSIRDELLAKQSIMQSELDSKQTNEELNKLNNVLSQRIESLENAKNKAYDVSKLIGLDHEELVKRIAMLHSEIKEIEAAFKETREHNIRKLDNVIEQESLVKKLTIEKTKADQRYFASMRSKDAITSENKVLKAQVNKSQELTNKFNELEASYLSKIDVLTKTINDYKDIKQTSMDEVTSLKESVKSYSSKREALEEHLRSLKTRYEEVIQSLNESANDVKSKDVLIARLESKLKSTEGLLKKYKANNTSSILQEDEKQLEALRSITKCSVCSKNWKNTAITVCGHVFCQNCTQERLAARLRRCPTCNKGFSANDLLPVHL